MDLFVNYVGAKILYEKGYFVVEKKGEKPAYFSFDNIDSIVISQGCHITTDFIRTALLKQINIYLSDDYGNIYGKISDVLYNSNSSIKVRQIKVFSSIYGKKIGREWIIEKIKNQAKHLKKIYSRRSILEEFSKIEKQFNEITKSIESINFEDEQYVNIIMGYEGRASILYYSEIRKFLPTTWQFEKRETQGATAPYNIVLNYIFGILYFKIEKYLILAGLDIQLGIFHSLNNKNKSLVYDFIEPFRIIGWETVFTLFTRKLINKNYFETETNKITTEGKKVIAKLVYEKLSNKIEYNGEQIKYENKIEKRAKLLAKDLMNNEIYNKL